MVEGEFGTEFYNYELVVYMFVDVCMRPQTNKQSIHIHFPQVALQAIANYGTRQSALIASIC